MNLSEQSSSTKAKEIILTMKISQWVSEKTSSVKPDRNYIDNENEAGSRTIASSKTLAFLEQPAFS